MKIIQSGNQHPPQWLVWAVVLLALVGFADAAYLTAEHYLGAVPVCTLTKGCETVLTSRFATVGPVPLAAVGAAYYLVIFVVALMSAPNPSRPTVRFLVSLTGLGFLTSLGLLSIQAFILHAYCLYCLVSAGTSNLLFATVVWLWRDRG